MVMITETNCDNTMPVQDRKAMNLRKVHVPCLCKSHPRSHLRIVSFQLLTALSDVVLVDATKALPAFLVIETLCENQ